MYSATLLHSVHFITNNPSSLLSYRISIITTGRALYVNIYSSLYNIPLSNTTSRPSTTFNHSTFATLHSPSVLLSAQPFISMPFHQSGPSASANIDILNDVGRDQNNFHGNEVFRIFDLYITINTHNIRCYRQQ